MYRDQHSVVLGVQQRKRFVLSSIALALISFQSTATADLTPSDSLLPNGGFNENYVDPDNPGTAYVQPAARTAPYPWTISNTPDISTDSQIAFTVNTVQRSSLTGFGPSPAGGSFVGFRSSEGVGNTLAIGDASAEMKLQFYYTEYNRTRTAPGTPEPGLNIEFKVNTLSHTGGATVATIPNFATTGGTEGTWVLQELTFVPADYGIGSNSTVDFYLGSVGSPSNTFGFIDGLIVAPTSVFVAAENEAPVATNATVSVLADANALVDLTRNVTDADGDADISTVDLDPSGAGIQRMLITGDGEWSIDPAGELTFDPAVAFQGVATIPYVVSDDAGNVSAPANVSVTVAGASPVATVATVSTATGTSVRVPLAGRVSDANGDVDIATIDLDPSSPAIDRAVATSDGDWTVNSQGVVVFDPIAGLEGVATIPFAVSDDGGRVSDPASVAVTVLGATPEATDDSVAVSSGTIASVDLSDNISDYNNDVVVNTIDIDTSTPGIQKTLATVAGTWTVDAAGIVSFAPDSAFQGAAAISYTVSDDDGNVSASATVTVTVGGAGPVADSESVATPQGTRVTIDVLDGDVDANNDIDTASLDLDPGTPGTQRTLTIPGEGTFSVADGVVVFEPDPAFVGDSTLEYTISDADGNVSNVAAAVVEVQLDSDGDGMPDIDDRDDDNDGIPDALESTSDSDADGIADYLDLDSDDDGIPDAVEAGDDGDNPVDTDGDGFADFVDEDSDADGLSDRVEGAVDTDGDELADYRDLDSDNDGIPDAVEGAVDTDDDESPDYLDLDSDGDGIPDMLEAGDEPENPVDTDGDSTPDFRDLDSDDDTIADSLEAGLDPADPLDTDGDSVADFLDLDSDNDGAGDDVEAGAIAGAPQDTDGNGIPDFRQPLEPVSPVTEPPAPLDSDNDGIPNSVEGIGDTDADGTPDYLDADADNDGIPDSLEAGVDAEDPSDTDGDGTRDYLDLDSDNDGLSDALEAGSDPANPVDSDGDALPDYLDLDSDNDGLSDVFESLGATYDNDADGMIDSSEVLDTHLDTDGDGTPDRLDSDSDNDGMTDTAESGESDLNGDGVLDAYLDSDVDGVPDSVDVDFTGGEDADGDGIDDYADADFVLLADTDGDGIVDMFDPDARDFTSTGLPDADGDGVIDVLEANAPDSGGKIYTGLDGSGATGPLGILMLGVPAWIAARIRRKSVKKSARR